MPGAVLAWAAPGGAGAGASRRRRGSFGLLGLQWSDDGSIEFTLPTGEWIRLFRSSGLEVLDLLGLRAPAGASTRHPYVTAAWAHRWPSEEIWRLRRN